MVIVVLARYFVSLVNLFKPQISYKMNLLKGGCEFRIGIVMASFFKDLKDFSSIIAPNRQDKGEAKFLFILSIKSLK